MYQRILHVCVILAGAGLVTADDTPRVPYPPPDRPRQTSAHGTVTAVDKESITVRGFDFVRRNDGDQQSTDFVAQDLQSGGTVGPHLVVFGQEGMYGKENKKLRCIRSVSTIDTLTLYPADGGDPIVMKLADQPERKFFAAGPLAEGGYGKQGVGSYRLADIRVGDRVIVNGLRKNTAEFADSVSIRGRPGGTVPPAADDLDKPPLAGTPWYHEYRNAEQDLAERGVPLPAGYREHKRWIHPAPPPREATPK